MPTTITFTPQANANFRFQVVLDNSSYNAVVTWSLFGARYFISLYTLAGKLVVVRPLTGTPLGYNISSITSANNIAVVTTSAPHTYVPGTVVPLAITGCTPTVYNGTFKCSILNTTQFTYPLATVYPSATGVGTVNYLISLTAGYFASTLTYFPDRQQFVISP